MTNEPTSDVATTEGAEFQGSGEANQVSPAPAAPVPTPTVRVTILKDPNTHQLELKCYLNGAEVEGPSTLDEISHLFNPAQKRLFRNRLYYSPIETIRRPNYNSIPLQKWVDWIGQWLLAKEARKAGATYESRALDEGAYLSVGDTLYRLSPVALIRTNKALAVAKRKAMESVSAERDNILAEAKFNAQGIIADATKKQKDAEAIFLRASSSTPPPSIVYSGGIPAQWDFNKSHWLVGMDLNIIPTGFDFEWDHVEGGELDPVTNRRRRISRKCEMSWPAVAQEDPLRGVKANILIPISADGSYALTGIKIAPQSPTQLPHISFSSACLSLGDAPRSLTTLTDYRLLKRSLTRAMARVQLNSLLVFYDRWRDAFLPFVPPDLDKALCGEGITSFAERLLREQTEADAPAGADSNPTQQTQTQGEPNDVWTA